MEELRCYTFTDFMLREIQQGIQAGHASMELVNKYMLEQGWVNGHAETVADWAKNHKTIVCLNGGMYGDVCDWLAFFESEDNPYPFAGFTEEPYQGGNLTSVAVILPARIYEGAKLLRQAKYKDDIHVAWDYLRKELRLGWTHDDGTPLGEQRTETYNEWERDLMNKLNGAQLAR